MDELTIERREELTDILAEHWADSMDLNELITFFIDTQVVYLNKLSMNDFVKVVGENDLID